MTDKRIPLPEEAIVGTDAVRDYDRGSRYFMMPQYKFFVWKIRHKGIRGGRVLEVGTGSGRLAIELARARGNFSIVAIDVSKYMLSKATENSIRMGASEKINFVLANASSLPFADRSFDLVISYASLHHWREPVIALNEAARVVKDTGKIIIRDNKRLYRNPFWRVFIWLITRFMNKRHREHWPEAIKASYTMPEIKEILSKSNLKDYRLTSDFIRFDMCIESPQK